MESETKNQKTLSRVKWQWKSNSNPFSKTEEPKWTSYSLEHNYLIERAYYDEKREVDLGDYTVSIRDGIQKKKGMIISQRPIRRIECENDETEIRSERYFETELPKSTNKIFGSLWHFVNFFSKRNLEIFDLAMQLHASEPLNDMDELNTKICPQLISCLEEELLRDEIKDDSISEFQKKMIFKRKKLHEELISLFRKGFASFEEFYGQILRSYTMNTDLYLNLNKYLRNESWTAIDKLLPYVICLCKAFFSLKSNPSNPQKTEGSLILYRGTALDEFALSSYQIQKVSKHFSWNSVTSTSTNREMAENFMYESADIKNKKFPVMFIIEIPLLNESLESDSLKWIDIHRFSALPKENEVILAPGCAFELGEVFTDKENRTTINLKLKHEVESLAHEGLIMQGAFQTEMMNGTQIKIVCLEGEELHEALKNLTGNKLIEEIEFSFCTFHNNSLEKMLNTLSTLEKARVLKLISCKYEDEQEISSLKLKNIKNCHILEVEISEVQDFSKIFGIQNKDGDYWNSLKKITIDFRDRGLILNKRGENFVLQELKDLTYLTDLTLDFSHYEMKDEGLSYVAFKGIKYLIQLTSLTLTFSLGSDIRDEGVNNFASQGLKYLTLLTSLTLDFSGCDYITDEGANSLMSQGLKYLIQLNYLNLNFPPWSRITQKGKESLKSQIVEYLPNLTVLILNKKVIIEKCCHRKIDEKQEKKDLLGVFSMNLIRIKAQNKLKLFLEDQRCTTAPLKNSDKKTGSSEFFKQSEEQVRDRIFTMINPTSIRNDDEKNYSAELIISSPKTLFKACNLTSLTLDFSLHTGITDKGVNYMASQALKFLTRLTSLNLDFKNCFLLTDTGLNHLASQALKNLTQLTSLTLGFNWCPQITERGMRNLASRGLKDLTKLTSLSLNFYDCSKITDKALSHLASQALKHLAQLTTLSLNFGYLRFRITDEGISNLAFQGLKHLTQLTSLKLNFEDCIDFTDKGVNNLASGALKYLIQLTSLILNFSYCSRITEEGVNNLIHHGIKHIDRLTLLTLHLNNCGIQKSAIPTITQGLHYFGFTLNEGPI